MFGLGYIGYMTFVVTLLREQGLGRRTVVAPSTSLLGLGVVASSWLWARRCCSAGAAGRPLALLNGAARAGHACCRW